MKRQIAKSGEELFLGYAGENAVTEVAFLVADKRSEYGEGQAEVLARRPYQGYCMPVPTRIEGDYVIWTPTKEDLSASGCGEVQMLYYVGQSCKRTEIYRTRINRSLGAEEPNENPGGGKPGQDGKDGLSAYELAVQQGFVGTLDEWLASLKGSKGDDAKVPEWAKQPAKPTYTAEEVGAMPAETVIPTKTSELQNDSDYQTKAEVRELIKQNSGTGTGEGLTQAQINALDGLFKICAYTTNPTIEYKAFKEAFGVSGVLPPPQPPISDGEIINMERDSVCALRNSGGSATVLSPTTFTGNTNGDVGLYIDKLKPNTNYEFDFWAVGSNKRNESYSSYAMKVYKQEWDPDNVEQLKPNSPNDKPYIFNTRSFTSVSFYLYISIGEIYKVTLKEVL